MQHLHHNNQVEPARFLTCAVGGGGGGGSNRSGTFNVVNANATTTSSLIERRLRPHHPSNLKCPRCDSPNTKFCYFNNYNQSQPRHFCKSCRRYWTRGGVLRNVPVGGGSRKSKRSSSSSSSSKSSSSSSTTTTTTTTAATTRTTANRSDSSKSKPAETTKSADIGPVASVSSRCSSDGSSPADDVPLTNSANITAEPDWAGEIHPSTANPSLIPFTYPSNKFGDLPSSSPSYQEQHEINQDDDHRRIFEEVNELKLSNEIVDDGGLIMDHPHHDTVPLQLDFPPVLFDSRLSNSGTADLGGNDHWNGYLDTPIGFFDSPGNHHITGDLQPLFWNHSLSWGEIP